jgi:DNA polymerase-3 subunit alpha
MAYAALLSSFGSKSIQSILQSAAPSRETEWSIVGLITSKKEIMTKKGSKMGFIRIEDLDAEIEAVVFSDLYAKKSDLLVTDRLVLMKGQVVREEGVTRMLARDVSDISMTGFKELHLRAPTQLIQTHLEDLKVWAKKYPGDLELKLRVPVQKKVDGLDLKSSEVLIQTEMQIQTHPDFMNWIQNQFGKGSVSLH